MEPTEFPHKARVEVAGTVDKIFRYDDGTMSGFSLDCAPEHRAKDGIKEYLTVEVRILHNYDQKYLDYNEFKHGKWVVVSGELYVTGGNYPGVIVEVEDDFAIRYKPFGTIESATNDIPHAESPKTLDDIWKKLDHIEDEIIDVYNLVQRKTL